MPIYNGEKYLREAIDSILKQSFADFEFLIVNDGSIDRTVQTISSYKDPRIRLVENDKNLGLINTLNKGFELSRGEYIVRMDCDDISLPERLKEQVDFMESNEDVGVSGTWFFTIGDSQTKVARYPDDQNSIRCGLLFNSVLAHPTIIIRKKDFYKNKLYYDPFFPHAEDYELWVRAIQFFKISNIRKVLLLYRIHPEQITSRLNEEQVETAGQVRLVQIDKLGINPTQEEFDIHQAISVCHVKNLDDHFYEKVDSWLCKLKLANDQQRVFPEPAFSKTLFRFFLSILNRGPLPIWRWLPCFFSSKLFNEAGVNKKHFVDYITQEAYYRLRYQSLGKKWKKIK